MEEKSSETASIKLEDIDLQKRDKIVALLIEGETSSVIIANKVKYNVAYVNQVKNELLRELLRSQESQSIRRREPVTTPSR